MFLVSRLLLAVIPFAFTASLYAQPVQLPDGRVLPEVDFERHVHALLDRQGCNAGACHGSSRSKGAFILSLVGESPERDYHVLTRFSRGRLLNFGSPDSSLLLQRPLGRTGHAGHRRLREDSWEYNVLRSWIAAGAPWRPGNGKVERIEVEPSRIVFTAPNQTRVLKVYVRFADGSRHDMTPFCDFRHPSNDVIGVTRRGEVTSLEPGVDTVMVVYRGQLTPVPVAVAYPALASYPAAPEVNHVDREVFARLRELNIVPADLTSDTDFLRRIFIDTIGSLPSPDEIRSFQADKRPDKRARKIDELLAHPRHASLWAHHWLAWTGNSTDGLPPFHHRTRGWRQMWFDWLRVRFEKNVPFDRIAVGIIDADSREGKSIEEWTREVEEQVQLAEHGFGSAYPQRRSLDLFWRALEYPFDPGERIASAFLGVRLDCARCHKHPLGPWTTADHQAFNDIFRQVQRGNSADASPLVKQELKRRQQALDAELAAKPRKEGWEAIRDRHALDIWRLAFRETYLENRPGVKQDGTDRQVFAGLDVVKSADPRRDFVRWLVARDNPYFARNIVNRTWAHYFGRGLVEPFDGFSDAAIPSHPRLLEALTREFAESGYDLRRLERTILMSRTYQLAFEPPSPKRTPPALFASRPPVMIPKRILIDLMCDAAGHVPQWKHAPAGKRTLEVVDLQGFAHYASDDDGWKERDVALAELFGRSETSDRCNLSMDFTSYLHLMSYPKLPELIRNGTRVKALVAWNKADDDSMIDEAMLALLTRLPTEQERALFKKHVTGGRTRAEAIEDVFWALFNAREFSTRR